MDEEGVMSELDWQSDEAWAVSSRICRKAAQALTVSTIAGCQRHPPCPALRLLVAGLPAEIRTGDDGL
jgi:hypothetical protein